MHQQARVVRTNGRHRGFAAVALSATAILATSSAAGAAVSSTTGAAQLGTAPASVAVGAYESNTSIRVFNESQVTLTAVLNVWTVGSNGTMTQTTMPAGACVQSHLVHYDTVGNGAGPTLSGGATFSQNIVGVVPINNSLPLIGRPLDITDASFGAAGTTYPAAGNTGRGVELFTADALSFNAASPKTLGFTFGGDGFDEVRVLTQCDGPPADVPEVPLNVLLPLAGLGVVGVLAARRRRTVAA